MRFENRSTSSPVASSTAVILTTPEELRAIVHSAIVAALATQGRPSEWLDAHGVAKLLGIHSRSVQKLASRSGLPAHRLGAKLLRYRREEVLAWAEAQGRRAAR